MDFIKNNINAICSHDGSLNNGFEIVSHPQSFKYILKNQDKFKSVVEKLSEWGFKSHDTETCGLHFHVTRPTNEDIIDKIWLVMETYKEELIKFSRRKYEKLTRWSSFLSDKGVSEEETKALYYIKKAKGNFDRYMALNLTNSKTIEFRIFKGTLNFSTFMASVELVNNIVSLCSDEKIKVTSIDWQKLTATPYCREYCEKLNINTNKKIKDNSLEILKKENKRKATYKKINKIINDSAIMYYQNFIKRVNKDYKPEEVINCIEGLFRSEDALTVIINSMKFINGIISGRNVINTETKNRVFRFINDLNFYAVLSFKDFEKISELLRGIE